MNINKLRIENFSTQVQQKSVYDLLRVKQLISQVKQLQLMLSEQLPSINQQLIFELIYIYLASYNSH